MSHDRYSRSSRAACYRQTRIFVSYSRRNYAFAQSLYSRLSEDERLAPWFDTAELRPGVDWRSRIDKAIDASDVLLVIASQDSLRSREVEREWRRALERGIRIAIVLFGPCAVPAELRAMPVYDFRGRFERSIGALVAACVWGEEPPPPPVRRPRVSGPVLGMQVIMVVLAATLMVSLVGSWVLYGLDVGPVGIEIHHLVTGDLFLDLTSGAFLAASTAAMVGCLIASALVLRSLYRRSVHFEMLQAVLLADALTVNGAAAYIKVSLSAIDGLAAGSWTDHLGRSFTWFIGLLGVGAFVAAVLMERSTAIRRISQVRGMTDHSDELAYAYFAIGDDGAVVGVAGVERVIVHHPYDYPVATTICAHLATRLDGADPPGPPKQLNLVSHEDDLAGLPAAHRAEEIVVLVSSVRMPDDDLLARQWLDFRRGSEAELDELVAAVVGAESGRVSPSSPIAPAAFVGPSMIQWPLSALFVQALVLLLLIVTFLLKTPSTALAGASLGVLSAALLVSATLIGGVANRTMRDTDLRRLFVLGLILQVVVEVLIAFQVQRSLMFLVVIVGLFVLQIAVALLGAMTCTALPWLGSVPGRLPRRPHLGVGPGVIVIAVALVVCFGWIVSFERVPSCLDGSTSLTPTSIYGERATGVASGCRWG